MSTLSRRSHRKTRTGCVQCKKRRIKCDEKKPNCQRCINHSIQCTYVSSISGGPSSFSVPPFLPERSHSITSEQSQTSAPMIPSASTAQHEANSLSLGLNMADLELLHHFSVSTCYTISRKFELVTLWRVTIPQIAVSQPFLMHAILAISALHLARLRPDKAANYASQAALHEDSALRSAREAMSNVTQDNCNALLAFSILVVMFAFARPREPDSLILIGSVEQGTAEWLLLLRGVHSILLSAWEHLENGILSPLFRVTAFFPPSENMNGDVRPSELDRLADVMDLVRAEDGLDETQVHIYAQTLEELGKLFCLMHDHHASMSDIMRTFIWPNRIPQGYISLLSERRPEALAIFAFYCVPLRNLELYWWMEGWSTHLLSTIYRLLDERHRLWMRWPMEQVGWEPERQM